VYLSQKASWLKKGPAHKSFPNLLNQHFEVTEKHKAWCTDFTYLFLSNGSLRYICTIIDLYDRSAVASETEKWITSGLAVQTLDRALKSQKVKPKNLVLHSDQGCQFASLGFVLCCRKHGVRQSMSRAGCLYDNAPMERCFNSLKAELISRFAFNTGEEPEHAIAEYAYL